MKLFKKMFKVNLFVSSYIPLYILIFINELEELNNKSIISVYNKNPVFWRIIFILSIFSIISLIMFFNFHHTRKENFKEVESINNEVLNYFITYIIPLMTVDITKDSSILLNLIIFFIIGVYYVESDSIYLNILLIFLGYKVYRDGSNNIIISRKERDYFKRNKNVLCKKIGNTKIFIVR